MDEETTYGTIERRSCTSHQGDSPLRWSVRNLLNSAALLVCIVSVAAVSFWAGQRTTTSELLSSSGVPLSLEPAASPQLFQATLPPGPVLPPTTSSLWLLYDTVIKDKEFVDLTHAFNPDIPHWKGFHPETVEAQYTVAEDGFWAEKFCHVGQWGTHVDPPAHFAAGKRTADEILPEEMFLPLVVIDVSEKCAENPDYVLSLADIHAWEERNGQKIPQKSFVAMRTDWSKKWPNGEAMDNKDAEGVAHYPGWSMPVLQYLYEERGITASGHETTDTDPGVAVTKDDYSLETYILAQDHYQIELLTNLDKVPEAGALIVASFPKPEHGSGFPARAFAILP